MDHWIYILLGLGVGALLTWLASSRRRPEFNKRLEDELREQIRQLQESLAAIRKELSTSNESRAAAETAKMSTEQALAERRELQQQAEKTAAELREKLSQSASESANARHALEVQEALGKSLAKDRDASKDSADKLQGELNETKQKNSALGEQVKFLHERLASEAENARQKLETQETAHGALAKERDEFKVSVATLQNDFNEIKQKNSALDEQLKFLNERLVEERNRLQTLQETFKKEFEAISNKLLLDSSSQFTKQSSESLENLLKPLKTNIDEFKAKLETAHVDAAAQSALLKDQIKNIGAEAANLSRALKGDAKALGNWGENMLDLILEKSGLQLGVHYRRQQSVTDGDDQRFLDVIIDLPDSKHLVIDSKVSLKHYETHVNCVDDALRQGFLDEHISCIENHFRGLSAKRYQDIYGINTPDFVLMYIPIEAAFFVAAASNPRLFADALDKNVVLITNSSLLATLRTVASVWRLADQKKNHLEIADRGGKLYDKFCLFINDLQKIGDALDDGKSAWDEAFKKLSTGSGNLVSQAEKLRKLGVKATKALPVLVLENSEEQTAPALPSPAAESVGESLSANS